MIARVWKGWTTPENADAYEKFVRGSVLPELEHIEGFRGGYILRMSVDDEVEFMVMTMFESIDAVRAFAGDDYTVPVIEPEARQLLSRAESIARHYDVKLAPGAA
jgi:heme-degrading monooxygenase HmoA